MFKEFYTVVKQIPAGKVMTYGQVARLAGFPFSAQRVGWALHNNPSQEQIPCHRVVFKDGRLSPAFAFGGEGQQRALLAKEGVTFIGDCVDMKKCQVADDL